MPTGSEILEIRRRVDKLAEQMKKDRVEIEKRLDAVDKRIEVLEKHLKKVGRRTAHLAVFGGNPKR